MIEKIRAKAKELLESKKVDVVIGYGKGTLPNVMTPVFITDPKDVDKLEWNEFCLNDLAVYLRHPSLKKYAKKAVIMKPCDIRAAIDLFQENQLDRENIFIVGVACDGMKDPESGESLDKCLVCYQHNPTFFDDKIGESKVPDQPYSAEFADIERYEQMTPDERWEF